MAYSRSAFLKGALRFGAVSAAAPSLLMDPRLAERVLAAGSRETGQNILVVVQLAGGNDGLNMIVPYGDSLYYQKRPTLAIPGHQVLPIDHHLGFNPGLVGLKRLYDRGQVAVVQGVGYPDPSFSHFRATDIWQSALPAGAVDTGWLGRYLDSALADTQNPLKAISIGPLLPKALFAQRTLVPAVESLESFQLLAGRHAPAEAQRLSAAFQRITAARTTTTAGPYLSLIQLADTGAYRATVDLTHAQGAPASTIRYPDSDLAGQLKLVSRIIATNLGTRVFMVTQQGFDDHALEETPFVYPRLMTELDGALAAFHADMVAQGRVNQVLLMTFSEFGRRPQENGSQGTDHGAAAPMLVIGGVKGGLYGQTPSLSNLDDGNLRFNVDFRSVYSTVLARWMGADPTPAVLGRFPTLPFV